MSNLCVIIDSGLGNQLFMIFTAISKAIDENRDFVIFPIYNNSIRTYYFTSILKKLVNKIAPNIPAGEIYKEPTFTYSPIPTNVNIMRGYFQSAKYFNHNKDKIIDLLDFNTFQNKFKLNPNTIGIHIRLGDMTFNQGNHLIMQPSYYINALFELNKRLNLKEYNFIIFGEQNDDELINDYIFEFKKHYDINFIKFYDIYQNIKDWQEMFYLSSCEHIIMPNSTFSWFSAYLCKNPNKLICYPNGWFGINNQQNSTRDLFLDNWIKVNI